LFPKESCEDAVRRWIEVKIRKQVPLQGGVSGASVYFVDTEVEFPGLQNMHKATHLRFVIKYSSGQSFEEEKGKFDDLPDELAKWFVNFATPGIPVNGDFFMIMPYLRKHKTLAHIVRRGNSAQIEGHMQKVCEVLKDIHFFKDEYRDPVDKQEPDLGKLLGLYLGEIQNSLEKNYRVVEDFPEIESKSFKVNKVKLYHPFRYLEKLLEFPRRISPCFSMWTHGDCHSRNVMIRHRDSDLRFIDIDRLRYDGDYIYDLGTLIADIEVYDSILQSRRPSFEVRRVSKNTFSYVFPEAPNGGLATKVLIDHIEKFSEQIGDKDWELRLSLSKARYLLSMVPKTIDIEKAFVVYCEGLKILSSLVDSLENKNEDLA